MYSISLTTVDSLRIAAMMYWIIAHLLLLTPFCQVTHSSDVQPYCQFQTFNATCRAGSEVVVMDVARYGRMEFGGCVDRDYGYVGCSADVLAVADQRCSGRYTCQISVPDALMHTLQPCPKDLSAYLEASYHCQTVHSDADITTPGQCPAGFALVTSTSGYLASVISYESGAGTDTCPWVIQVSPGQRLNVTLWDFSVAADDDGDGAGGTEYCKAYAVIRDRLTGNSHTICGGQTRVKPVYISQTNQVEIRTIYNDRRPHKDYFMFQYQAFGCPTLATTETMHVDYVGERAYITCDLTDEQWQLTCKDNVWTGSNQNCTTDGAWGSGKGGHLGPLPAELTIALIAGIAFVVIVFVLVVGLLCLKRHHLSRGATPPSTLLADKGDQYGPRKGLEKAMPPSAGPARTSAGEYASIWESQYTRDPRAPHAEAMQPYVDQRPYGSLPVNRTMASYGVDQFPSPAQQHHRPVDHIYESPKFDRHNHRDNCSFELPVYYELDPDQDQPPRYITGNHGSMCTCEPTKQIHGRVAGPKMNI